MVKTRVGFVSNSSSASFIVRVKGEKKKIFCKLYENIEVFKEASYIGLLQKAIELEESHKNCQITIDHYKRELQYFSEHPNLENRKTDFAKENHIERLVTGVFDLKYWYCTYSYDGYFSFGNSTLIYNGWEDIAHRQDFLEVLAYFTFMRYEVQTRIENDL